MPVITIHGIEIDFPFKPYDVQISYMTKVIEALQTKENAVLESPTGTGKTLCLLCATLAWRKSEIANIAAASHDNNEPLSEGLAAWQEQSNSKMNSFAVPRILYASRTHSQLTQVVNELKQTTYGKSKCSIDSMKHGIFTNNIMDIEDLVTVGKQRNACPYYAAREASKQSDCAIIFTPYNYLLDKRSRRSHNLEIGDNIIIFDEAHNLEKHCEESASFDITSLDFAHCIEEVGDLLNAVTKMKESGVLADGHEAGESSALSEFSKDELALLKKFFLTLEKQLDEIDLPASKSKSESGKFIFDFFSKVNLTFETYDILLALIEKVSAYLSTLSNPFRTRGVSLQKFSDIIKIVFSAAPGSNGNFPVGTDAGSIRDEVSRNYRVHICEDEKKNLNKKDVWKKETTLVKKPSRTLSYWCFSPGYAMKELMGSGARNLILTSGTLSPIDSFTAELQVDFPITLENSHVIDKYQMFVASISIGIHGGKLDSTYKSRSEDQKVVELGRTVVEILKLSPGGALVFFPSYAAMGHYVTAWREQSNVLEMCELSKACTIEPRKKADMKMAIGKYYDDVKTADGGALFAVCRGKVSEGLDFANDNGRVVIIIGIPFPPSQDPKVKLKMAFLDDLRKNGNDKSIKGNDWYRQQACRAVNQAIGRVIRHRYDYGAIVLCDYRYSRKDQVDELPKWVQSHVNQFEDCPKFLRRLKSFFCSVKEKEKLRISRNEHPKSSLKTKTSTDENGNRPGKSTGLVSFATTQDFVRKLPKFNDLDVHVPSVGCPWWETMRKSAAPPDDDGNCSFFDTGKRKRAPVLTPECECKKVGLLDALDHHVDDASDDETTGYLGDQADKQSTSARTVKSESQPSMKRKKIKLKPNAARPSVTTSDVPSTSKKVDHHPMKPGECPGNGGVGFLLQCPASVFLDTVRRSQSRDNYLRFKNAVGSYKRSGDLQTIVGHLSEFLLVDEQSRDLLRAFVRFLRIEHHEQYKEAIDVILAKSSSSS